MCNRSIYLIFSLVVLLAFSPALATPPSDTTWSLVWSDEFSGTGIDADKWDWGLLPWGGYYQGGAYASYTTAEDSYLSNGSVILRSRKAVGGEFGGQPWSQGFMFGNEWPLYGYGEIRAKHTKANGIWVGFWMLHYGWPPEFDIAEYYGSDDLMRMALIYNSGPSNLFDRVFVGPYDWENWHTYGMEWGPGYADFYMDDVLQHSIEAAYVPDVPMYLILQSGMDATYDAQTPNPNYYEVDYIRWYKDDNLPRYQDPDILPVIKDCTNDAVTYTGTWLPWEGNPVWMGNEYYTNVTSSLCEFSFTGTKVAYYGTMRNDMGLADIYIDGQLVDTVDCYNKNYTTHQKLYESNELAYGSHTIGVEVKGEKRRQSRDYYVIIDAFRYSPYSGSYCGDSTCDPDEDNCNCPGDCGTPSSTETVCDDGNDDDCDGLVDCDDPDCASYPTCDFANFISNHNFELDGAGNQDLNTRPMTNCLNWDGWQGSEEVVSSDHSTALMEAHLNLGDIWQNTIANGLADTVYTFYADIKSLTGSGATCSLSFETGGDWLNDEETFCVLPDSGWQEFVAVLDTTASPVYVGRQIVTGIRHDNGDVAWTNVRLSICGDGTCSPGESSCGCPSDCGAPASTEANCTDGVDDDCDGFTDCADSECSTDPACEVSYCGDATCDPGEDQCNCPGDCGTPPATETNCTDGIDEDCDGAADCADPTGDCDTDPACQSACDNDGVCEPGEDCNNCSNDCDSQLTGPPNNRYCCGDGEQTGPEGDGRCDGNY